MRALIVMATHNARPDLLRRQVASIRSQTVEDWHCLVFDDASRDADVVAQAVAGDPRFRLLPATGHLGTYRAFEHLLEHAEADVPVFLCDQDDFWQPDKMQRLLATGGTAFSAMRVVDEAGRVVRERFLPRIPGAQALTPAGLLLMNSVSGAALAITPQVRRAALPFPAPSVRGWHDQWLAAVAARTGTLTYVDEPLVDYTRHPAQVVGDGLRQVDQRRVGEFLHRLRSNGPIRDLVSRTSWVMSAAQWLLELPGPADPDLEAIAMGRFTGLLAQGVRTRDVPVARAVLLAVGRAVR